MLQSISEDGHVHMGLKYESHIYEINIALHYVHSHGLGRRPGCKVSVSPLCLLLFDPFVEFGVLDRLLSVFHVKR